MAEINSCLLPDELQYHIEFNVWLKDNGDGTFDLGMTDIAQSMAGSVIHCRAKAVGKNVKKEKVLLQWKAANGLVRSKLP